MIQTPILFINLFTIFAILAVLFYMNYILALVAVLLCGVYFVIYKKINKGLRESSQKQRQDMSKMLHVSKETVDGIQSIKLFLKEDFFIKRFVQTLNFFLKNTLNMQYYQSFGLAVNEFMTSFMPLCSLVIGVYLIIKGHSTIGIVISFYSYMSRFTEPLQNLAVYNVTNQQAKSVEERVLSLFPSDEQIKTEKSTQEIDEISDISFENFEFSYPDGRKILSDFNLKIQKGDRIAVTGESGAGKSTLIKILLGQIKIQSDNFKINNIPLNNISYTSYIEKFAILPQKSFMFDGTVKENIAFDKEVELQEIIKIVCLDTSYFDKNVTELSGGECQRVAIARAILASFDILILDEATSALDDETESRLIANLDKFLKNKDTILIAITHRKAILNICNKNLQLKGDCDYEIKEI